MGKHMLRVGSHKTQMCLPIVNTIIVKDYLISNNLQLQCVAITPEMLKYCGNAQLSLTGSEEEKYWKKIHSQEAIWNTEI